MSLTDSSVDGRPLGMLSYRLVRLVVTVDVRAARNERSDRVGSLELYRDGKSRNWYRVVLYVHKTIHVGSGVNDKLDKRRTASIDDCMEEQRRT